MRLSSQLIKDLANFDTKGSTVVSLYLNVDGKQYIRSQDYQREFDSMLKRAKSQIEQNPLAKKDIERIYSFVQSPMDRSKVRGIALFSSLDANLWKVVELPVPVQNFFIINTVPQLRQLESICEASEKIAILNIDRQRGRVIVFELGEVIESQEVFDELPRHEDDKGDWERDHLQDHKAVLAHKHIRKSAQLAFDLFKKYDYEHLVISGSDDVVAELEKELHSYLKDRIVLRANIGISSPSEEYRRLVEKAEEKIMRTSHMKLIEKIRDKAAVGTGIVTLKDTLGALSEKRIETLMVSNSFEKPGWRCPNCTNLAEKGPICSVCGSDMQKVEDLIEEVIQEALHQSCKIVTASESADLDCLGGIAALLRY